MTTDTKALRERLREYAMEIANLPPEIPISNIPPLEAAAAIERLEAERERYRAALAFYADPDTYFAIGFFPDPPCGEFMEDFSEDHGGDYDRPMPGKAARAALKGEG